MTPRLRRFVIEDGRFIPPFNEAARELSFMGKSLKLHQEELLRDYFGDRLEARVELPLQGVRDLPDDAGPSLVYRESIYFDRPYLEAFFVQAEALARQTGKAVQAAYAPDDPVFTNYVRPLTRGFEPIPDERNPAYYLADLWYFPDGYTDEIEPLIVSTDALEKGFYSVPHYMSQHGQDLTHWLSERVLFSVESWVHVYFANTVQGVFSRGSRYEEYAKSHNLFQFKVLWRALIEQKQVLSCSEVVRVGPGTDVHPTATVLGPTTIGSGCYIGPGVVIDNCHIGDNVSIDQGCQLMTSVIGDNCFFPFRAASYFSVFMEGSMLAQNACIQMCVIGRNTFVGAGNTFTDFNLLSKPIRAMSIHGLEEVSQIVLGGCVGHNCRIGSGFVIYPARMIESDTILEATGVRSRVLQRNLTFEHSLHHRISDEVAGKLPRFYPRADEDTLTDEW